MSALEEISKTIYPGRIIIIGSDGGTMRNYHNDIIVYALTGRSPSSRARKLSKHSDGTIGVDVTDLQMINEENSSLLIYDAIKFVNDDIVVSNGAQTNLVADVMSSMQANGKNYTASSILERAFERPYMQDGIDLTREEPDAPIWTPRITGVVTKDGSSLSIVKWGAGSPIRSTYSWNPNHSGARMIPTYDGIKGDYGHTPKSFSGEPLQVFLVPSNIEKGSSKFVANNVYEALAPKRGEDLRITVACVVYNRMFNRVETHIINRSD